MTAVLRRPRIAQIPYLGWRPQLHVETLALLASAYFAIVSNPSFWNSVAATGAFSAPQGWRTAVSLFVAMVSLQALLLCLLLTRRLARPVLALVLVVTAAASYFTSRYGVHFDPGMIRNVLRSDGNEGIELITPSLGLAIAVQGVLPALLLLPVRLRPAGWRESLVRRIAVVLVLLTATVLALLFSFQPLSGLMHSRKELRYLIAPGNYATSLMRVILDDVDEMRGPRRVIAADAKLAGHAMPSRPHLLVIVVGETVRAGNWGLNGYGRQTTPQLARAERLVNFSDVTACGSNTEVSVPCMFSSRGRRGYDRAEIRRSESLLHVLERAGVRTLWRDNQTGCKGVCDGLSYASYRDAPDDPLCDGRVCRDTIMLKGLLQAISANQGDTVVVLHQLGNHGPEYFRRYPAALRRFRPDCRNAELGKCTREEIVNAYDNAVLATDDFLARTIRMLEKDRSHDTAMIYMSDHGESLGEDNLYLHGLPYAIAPDTQLKVPMVAWISRGFSESRGLDQPCLERRAARPISHDTLFHSVLGLMEVSTQEYDRSLDVFADCVRPAPESRRTTAAGGSPLAGQGGNERSQGDGG